jgi:hypothetical protein
MNLIEKYLKWKNTPNRAPVNLRNIWAVLQAFFRKNVTIPAHIQEQATWRLTQVRPECKANGTCVKCGCVVEEKVWEDRSCEGKCYPPMMPKSYWEQYKEFINDKG